MVKKKTAFYAYPGTPNELTQTIRYAVERFNSNSNTHAIEIWEKNDIAGIPLVEPIFTKISHGDYLVADITYLNENVVFEVGYAIGCKKRCLLLVNENLSGDRDLAQNTGIFDTLGYGSYTNSQDLSSLLLKRGDFTPIAFNNRINHQQPIYIVEPAKRNDASLRLVSRVKKARWKYRSFNPDEDIRLSAMDAIRHVSQSAGVIVTLQSSNTIKYRENNLRAMFVAGLSCAMNIPTLLLHSSDLQPPLDVRDLTKKYSHPDDIDDAVQAFALDVTDYIQETTAQSSKGSTVLTDLTVGDPTAENEMTTLSSYYLSTDEYHRAIRGEVNLVVGRKGSGKTALFVQLRNNKRNHRQNVVVDLKPEGFQLVKLKERVLDFLTAGAQEHLITAFWHYILLLEITYKVLEKDRKTHIHNHILVTPYQNLSEIYGDTELSQEGDFRERLSKLSDQIIHAFLAKFKDSAGKHSIMTNQVTEILYQHDIPKLYNALVKYLLEKEEVWLLFDNIDKGWNVDGITNEDILILRCLINASRKLEREFRSKDIPFHSVVFVRDDVYTLLMKGSSDYGKEMRAALDWSDPELLGEVLKRRITSSLNNNSEREGGWKEEEKHEWKNVCVSHYSGEPWLNFMVSRSLMRPRNLLKIFQHSLAYAINLGHSRIEASDIKRGLKNYAQDLIIEVDRELTDIFPKASKLIYEFSEENSAFTPSELSTLIQCAGLDEKETDSIINYLLFYGIIGVKRFDEEPVYIYDVNYDAEMLKVRIKKWGESMIFEINPALWSALRLTKEDQLELNIA